LGYLLSEPVHIVGYGAMNIERGKIHGFSRIGRILAPKIRVNPWTVCKRPDAISA
jgi:hypothetical protein